MERWPCPAPSLTDHWELIQFFTVSAGKWHLEARFPPLADVCRDADGLQLASHFQSYISSAKSNVSSQQSFTSHEWMSNVMEDCKIVVLNRFPWIWAYSELLFIFPLLSWFTSICQISKQHSHLAGGFNIFSLNVWFNTTFQHQCLNVKLSPVIVSKKIGPCSSSHLPVFSEFFFFFLWPLGESLECLFRDFGQLATPG